MDIFAERLDWILKEKCIDQAQLYRKMGMPQSTFLYKKKHGLTTWNVVEFLKLTSLLSLTPDEFDFLTGKVA